MLLFAFRLNPHSFTFQYGEHECGSWNSFLLLFHCATFNFFGRHLCPVRWPPGIKKCFVAFDPLQASFKRTITHSPSFTHVPRFRVTEEIGPIILSKWSSRDWTSQSIRRTRRSHGNKGDLPCVRLAFFFWQSASREAISGCSSSLIFLNSKPFSTILFSRYLRRTG